MLWFSRVRDSWWNKISFSKEILKLFAGAAMNNFQIDMAVKNIKNDV
jgi:hypothetical protein